MRTLIFAAALLAASPTFAAEWNVWRSEDPIDDSITVVAGTTSTSGYIDSLGFPRDAYLRVRCNPNGVVDTFVTIGSYILGERVPVRYRFDSEDHQSETWPVATNNKAVFAASGSDIPEKLSRGNSFLISVEPERSQRLIAEFSLVGSASAIAEVIDACYE